MMPLVQSNKNRAVPFIVILSSILAGTLAASLSQGVAAAIITVDTTLDDTTVNGNCTLREAIIAANTDTAVGGCSAGNGADLITVPAGTITTTIPGIGELHNVTISNNNDINAGGIFDQNGGLFITNTILANNNPDDCGDVTVSTMAAGPTACLGKAGQTPCETVRVRTSLSGARAMPLLIAAEG